VSIIDSCSVREGATLHEGAGVIHADFEKKFIKGKINSFKDFIQY
jgi:ribosome-binding ATPase YchF (GTP1/OBG family)